MLLHPPATGLEAEVRQHELRRLERPVAIAQRRPHPGIAEAHDVGPAVAGDVGEEARMLLHPPAAGLEAEVRQHELRRLERAVAVAQRRPHPGIAEAHDVGPAVAGDVGQEARVLLHPPATGLEAEVRQHELRRLERAVAIAQRRPHPGIAEAHDVGPAVTGDVGEEARVLLHPPATGLVAEVRQHEPRRLERPVAIAQRRPHPGIAEAHDVGSAVTGDVGEEARVPVDAPPPRSVPVRALLDSRGGHGREGGRRGGRGTSCGGSSLEKLPKKRMNTQSVGSDGSSDGRFWMSGR